jgi:hypothetical protein
MLYGIPAEVIAQWCQVHITTARRWKRYGDVPYAAQVLITIRATGDVSMLFPGWRDWSLRNGEIVAPDGVPYSPGEILAVSFYKQLAANLQAQQRLPQQADWVESEWVDNEIAEVG